MATNAPLNTEGILLPTTNRYDSQIIEDLDLNSPEFKQFLVWIQQELNDHANYMNRKDYAAYDLSESINGQSWFQGNNDGASTNVNFRQVYRKVVDLGPLPAAPGDYPFPHGIDVTLTYAFTRVYGEANKQTAPFRSLPIPYASAVAADVIEMYITATDIHLVIGKDLSAYTKNTVVLEYVKS